jgi:hypothetical protein
MKKLMMVCGAVMLWAWAHAVDGEGALSGNMVFAIPLIQEHSEKESLHAGQAGKIIPTINGTSEGLAKLDQAWLEALEKEEFAFWQVPLGVVLQTLAEVCKINYIAPNGDIFDQEVTMRVVANPYQVMKLLASQYGITMEQTGGMWEFYQEDYQELIPRTYQLLFSDGSSVHIRPPSVSGSIRAIGGSGDGSGGRNGDVFDNVHERILTDIRELLGLSLSPHWQALSEISTVSEFIPMDGPRRKRSGAEIQPGGQVYYIPETTSLLVIASRPHHRMVEQYLRAIDQRQKLVKIQAMIVETSRPEKLNEGVNWSGVSGTPFGVSQLSRDFQRSWARNEAFSSTNIAWTVDFLKTDEESRVVNDPVAVTLNRRAVRFETVTELPVQTGSSSTTSPVASSSVQQTEYIEIGFFLDVIPQIIPGGIYGWDEEAVQLDVSIVVSNQVGQQFIGDRPYPITARRTYAYSVVVPSGYTLAIGGLREEGERETTSSIPLLGDLPLLGFLFRNTATEKINRNLIAYITPTILDRDSPEFVRANDL